MTTFAVESDFFGKPEEIDLIEGGRLIPVTNINKKDYVEKLSFFKLYKSI
jgi:HECT-domain (ubiquitin-transferase)